MIYKTENINIINTTEILICGILDVSNRNWVLGFLLHYYYPLQVEIFWGKGKISFMQSILLLFGICKFYFFWACLREAAKKVLLLMAGPEKNIFFGTFFSSVPTFQRPLSSRGGGLGLNGPVIQRITFFCGFPQLQISAKM